MRVLELLIPKSDPSAAVQSGPIDGWEVMPRHFARYLAKSQILAEAALQAVGGEVKMHAPSTPRAVAARDPSSSGLHG